MRLGGDIDGLDVRLGRANRRAEAAEREAAKASAESRRWASAFAGIRTVMGDWVHDADELPAMLAERLGIRFCAKESDAMGWAPRDREAGHRPPCMHPLIPPPLPGAHA